LLIEAPHIGIALRIGAGFGQQPEVGDDSFAKMRLNDVANSNALGGLLETEFGAAGLVA
jgi:hypothetical protein